MPLTALAQDGTDSIGKHWKKPPIGDFESRNEPVLPPDDLLQSISENEVSQYKEDLAGKEKELGPENPAVATCLYKVAVAYQAQGKYRMAETAYKRCLAIREKTLGPNHPDVANCLDSYATLLRQTNREAQAAKMEARANAILAFAKSHNSSPQAKAVSQDVEKMLNNRAITKLNKGDVEGAMADLNEVIRLNPTYVTAYLNRGLVKHKLGDNSGAIADYCENLRLQGESIGSGKSPASGHGFPMPAYVLMNRGEAKYDSADNNGAIDDYSRALELYPNYADAYSKRGLAKQRLGDAGGAIEDFKQAERLHLPASKKLVLPTSPNGSTVGSGADQGKPTKGN